jgi:CubicO group peptidase (beta-lactamase class C family)
MGDRLPDRPLPREIDAARLAAATDTAFADPEALTAAFVVVYRGRIVAERYRPGITKDTQLESWSMGKSVTATLFGLLVRDGVYSLDQEAPVPEWHRPGDPRSKIRISDLLRMSSGLRFIAGQDADYTPDLGYPDHMYIYTGAVDAFRYSIDKPLQFPPGTEGRYRNSDPLTIGWLIKQAVTKRGGQYLTFPQRALFDRIGIRRMVLETDPYGNFLLTGYDYGTARNWARLGLLYLNDGVWEGERLLPEGWSRFVSTRAPAWKRPVYGGLFWINGDGEWNLPKDAYFMAGAGGQRTFVVPSHHLVVVRMGHFRGDRPGMRALNAALAELLRAIPADATRED